MKLAIVCGSPSSEMLAPFHDESYEIWVLGNRCDRYPRYTRIFEIHDDLTQHEPDYPQWLVDRGVPLVVGESFPITADNAEVFPYQKTIDLYGSLYLTSSSACMLAYALIKGFRHVELFGVDMAVDDHEYFWQRPCMESWVGFAKGMGANVIIPDSSPLGKCDYVEGRDFGFVRPEVERPVNDYSDLASSHEKRRDEALSQLQNIESILAEADVLKAKIAAHDGARQAYERMAKVERAIAAKQKVNPTDTVVMQ